MAKQIKVNLDGNTYTLEFNWAALKKLGVVHPLDLEEVTAANKKLEGSFDEIAEWVSAGLAKHHPDVTREVIAGMLDYEAYGSLVQALSAASGGAEDPALPLPRGDSIDSTRGSESGSECTEMSSSPSA